MRQAGKSRARQCQAIQCFSHIAAARSRVMVLPLHDANSAPVLGGKPTSGLSRRPLQTLQIGDNPQWVLRIEQARSRIGIDRRHAEMTASIDGTRPYFG